MSPDPVARDSRPRVSVIMIFLDAEAFMDDAIRSVLAQTLTDWELLLVDDGSIDRSTEIARGYGAQHPGRIRYLDHPGHVNLGMSASRNAGLAAAEGRYVAWLDADDVYLPERLERHVDILERQPAVAMVQGSLEYWRSWNAAAGVSNDDGFAAPPPVPLSTPVPPPSLLLLLLQSEGFTTPGICSLTARREALVSLGGSVDSFRAAYEDQVLVAKVYLRHAVWVTDDRLARYRQHAKSTLHGASAEEYSPGRPHAARARYLDWLRNHLIEQRIDDAEVWMSLERAAWPYRHPVQWRIRHAPQEALRAVRRAAERVLPAAVVDPLVRWYGHRKVATAALRTEQAGLRLAQRLKAGTDGKPVERGLPRS